MTIILHITAIVCIIIITVCATSLWLDTPEKRRAQIKRSIICNILVAISAIAFALALVWAMFLAPAEMCM